MRKYYLTIYNRGILVQKSSRPSYRGKLELKSYMSMIYAVAYRSDPIWKVWSIMHAMLMAC